MSHLLALVAVALFAVRLLLFALLHVRPGGIDPVRDTVSDYAASREPATRRIAGLASWTASAAWAALGTATLAVPGPTGTGVGLWLLVLAGVLAAMPMVPTDGPGAPLTLRGRAHLLLAVAWFTIAYSSIGPLGDLLVGDPSRPAPLGHRGLAVPWLYDGVHALAAIALAALVISLVVRGLRRRTFGLAERAFILLVTVAPLLAATGLAMR